MNNNSVLFQPFEYGSLSLANRFVMAPCTRQMSNEFIPGPEVAAYYRRRAEGGVALIISEGTTINHPSANAYLGIPAFHGEQALAGWRHVVDEIHQAGSKFIPQLWHVGPARQEDSQPNLGEPAISASGLIVPGQPSGRSMTQQDIDAVIVAYAQAAADAKAIGCDGVQIHGAHGYLIDNFFWTESNQRNDHYGGSMENRQRLAVEIIQAVREAVGKDFPIMFRFSQWKQMAYSAKVVTNPQELEAWLIPLAEAGVDIFDASMRRFWESEFSGSDLNLAAWAKKITGKPAVAVGSVGLDTDMSGQKIDTPDQGIAPPLEEMFMHDSSVCSLTKLVEKMTTGEFDLIAVGRAMLADPQWVNKVKQGDLDKLRPYTKEVLYSLD